MDCFKTVIGDQFLRLNILLSLEKMFFVWQDTAKSRNKKENNEPSIDHHHVQNVSPLLCSHSATNGSPKKSEKLIEQLQSILKEEKRAASSITSTKRGVVASIVKAPRQATSKTKSGYKQQDLLFKETTNTSTPSHVARLARFENN